MTSGCPSCCCVLSLALDGINQNEPRVQQKKNFGNSYYLGGLTDISWTGTFFQTCSNISLIYLDSDLNSILK